MAKLKLDGDGHVVLENGMPVWITDEGSEIAYDAPGLFASVAATRTERDAAKTRAKEAEAILRKFGSNDAEYAKSLERIALASKIDESKLVASDKLEEAVNLRLQPFVAERAAEKAAAEAALAQKDTQLRSVLLSGKFATAEFTKKLYPTPDMIEAKFGAHFKIENGEVVAYHDPACTNKIYSKKDPSKSADFNEALETVVTADPNFKRWAKPNAANGGNAVGGEGSSAGGADTSALSPDAKMEHAFSAQRAN